MIQAARTAAQRAHSAGTAEAHEAAAQAFRAAADRVENYFDTNWHGADHPDSPKSLRHAADQHRVSADSRRVQQLSAPTPRDMSQAEIRSSMHYYINDLKRAASARDTDEVRFNMDRLKDLHADMHHGGKLPKPPAYGAQTKTIHAWADEMTRSVHQAEASAHGVRHEASQAAVAHKASPPARPAAPKPAPKAPDTAGRVIKQTRHGTSYYIGPSGKRVYLKK